MKKWEPKQEEYVRYDHDVDGQCHSFVGRYVTTYDEKYLVNDNGKFLLVESIESITEQYKSIIGSVWEEVDKQELWVLVTIGENEEYSFYSPSSTNFYELTSLEQFTPRPDKIGMAQGLFREANTLFERDIKNFKYYLSIPRRVFSSVNQAMEFADGATRVFVKWPVNNSSWVIIDKE